MNLLLVIGVIIFYLLVIGVFPLMSKNIRRYMGKQYSLYSTNHQDSSFIVAVMGVIMGGMGLLFFILGILSGEGVFLGLGGLAYFGGLIVFITIILFNSYKDAYLRLFKDDSDG